MLTKFKTNNPLKSGRKLLTRSVAALIFGASLTIGVMAQTTPPPPIVPPTVPPTVQPTPPVVPNPQPQPQPTPATPQATPQPVGTPLPGATPSPGATPGTQPNNQRLTQDVGGTSRADLPLPPPPIEPNYEAPIRPLPSVDRVGVDAAAQAPMSLNEAITLALENNNEIETSQIDVRLAEFDLRAARGIFDPRVVGESYYQRATTPTASTLGSANGAVNTSSFVSNLGVSGFSPFAGGSYQSSFNTARQTTDAPFTLLNPQFPSSLVFSYTQPLLRGRSIDDNRRRIQIARKNLSLTDAQFRQQAVDIITRVTQAYWDLAFALRNLQVQIDAVKQARTQAESNRRRVQEGVIAPIDIVAADTQVTNFEQNVYTAQEQVTRAEATLKTLLLPDKNALLWTRAIVPVTPVTLDVPRAAFSEALDAAYKNRPELDQLQTNREINEINQRFFRDQTKPQVDLIGSVTSAGLAGTVLQSSGANPLTSVFGPVVDRLNVLSANAGLDPIVLSSGTSGTVPGNLIGGYGQSLQNIAALRYPTYQIGVRIDLPIGNRTAKANLGRSLAEGTRIENQIAQTEQQIKFDVQTSLQTLRSAEARLASAAASRASTEQLYGSEQRRYESGTSTIFLVLQRQQELVVARSAELQAQTELNKAISNFQKATGNTFEANNVDIGPQSSRNLQITTPATNSSTPSAGRAGLR